MVTPNDLIKLLQQLPEDKKNYPLFLMDREGVNYPVLENQIDFATETVYKKGYRWLLLREKPAHEEAEGMPMPVVFMYI